MLRIERMEVQGFKSFVDHTVIEFPDGVTAVVGPNGCGKSNIADAMQWALGEQSARALRGSRMEDVIFAGSDKRGPGGMAEVTLHLVARDQSALEDGRSRVALTRRLYRTGDSEYLIDGAKSRLTDIRQLLEQIRAGARTYAIIDQAHVASFVISKPKERRLFIEEAAGIAGYKDRRRQADIKLEATRANLLRVEDILREVDRQRKQLQRQASAARRARRLDEELIALRSVWYRQRAERLGREANEQAELHAVAQRESQHLESERDRLAAGLAERRAALDLAHRQRAESMEAAHRTRLDDDRLKGQIESWIARVAVLDAEANRQEGEDQRLGEVGRRTREELARLEAQLATLAGQHQELQLSWEEAQRAAESDRQEWREIQHATAAMERELYDQLHQRAELSAALTAASETVQRETQRAHEAEQSETRLRHARHEASLALETARHSAGEAETTEQRLQVEVQTARGALQELQAQLELARAAEARIAAELGARSGEKSALDTLDVRLAGADATRDVLERGLKARAVLADLFVAPRELERAAEQFLGYVLPALVVDSEQQIRAAASLGPRGRVSLFPLDAPVVADVSRELPAQLKDDRRVLGTLIEKLTARHPDGARIAPRLQDAILVESLDAALELSRKFPRFNFLSLDGHTIAADGVVTLAGSGESQDGLLARARRRDELEAQVSALELELTQAGLAISMRRDELARLTDQSRLREEALGEARRVVATARLGGEQAERDLLRLERELSFSNELRGQATSALSTITQRSAELTEQLAEHERKINQLRQSLEGCRQRTGDREDAARRSAERLGSLGSDLRASDERRISTEQALQRLRYELAEIDQHRDRGVVEREQAAGEAIEVRQQIEAARVEQERLAAARALGELELNNSARRVDQVATEVKVWESRLAIAAEHWEEARATRETAALAAERARIERDHVIADCLESMGVTPEELPLEVMAGEFEPISWDDDESVLQSRIQVARDKRERVGPVNLLAEKEFEELSTRFEELDGQKQDLDRSMEELRESIRKMDRECRERFLDAFTNIRRYFREQFAVLFRGGKADLRLEDEEHPLDSGIEIVCQPPGKKLQSVSLMSGGEKALAATAVLFAIFRYQPPPFCLLDEVDAPLDEANVSRFADALRSFSSGTQIILITHNKRSMEMADLLYGVTMPEPGVSRMVSMTLD